MAILANATETFDAVGIREDLSDLIYMISPTETPFMSSIGRATARQTKHEWQTDALAAAALNAQIEGDDTPSYSALTPTQRIFNHTQIAFKAIAVTGTMRAVNTAGRADELAYQRMKRSKEIKRDMEFGLSQNVVIQVGAGDGATARRSGGYEVWLLTNRNMGAGGAAAASTSGQPNNAANVTDGTQRAFVEADLKDVLQRCFTEGGRPNLLVVGPKNKQNASGFAGNATRFDRAEDNRLHTAYEVYVSDYGEVTIVPDRFTRERSALVIDTSMWAVAYLRPFRIEVLAKTGDADKEMLIVEYSLEARNEKSSGIVADLTT